MPEPSSIPRSPIVLPPPGVAAIPYAELHCRTNFSFLEGASHAEELAGRAGELGYRAIAVTDRNSLAGAVRAHVGAKEAGVKLLVGAELTPVDAPPIVVWAIDRAGYGRLARLLTIGRRNAPKGECCFTFDDIASHAAGLLAGVILGGCHAFGDPSRPRVNPLVSPRKHVNPLESGSSFQSVHMLSGWDQSVHSGPQGAPESMAPMATGQYRDVFGDRLYALAELHHDADDDRRLAEWISLTKAANIPLVAANDVHYHVPERRILHDVVTAVRHGCTVAELGYRRFANGERHLKSPAEMQKLFAKVPGAIERTIEIAERCHFSLAELKYEYPEELCPAGTSPLEHLTKLTWEGAARRYPQGTPEKVRGLILHELALIEELHYEAYFLTVWDLVRFANERKILCQGRGSAANSAVCYCIGITSVPPELIDALFERFVSKERDEAPDIDVDFEHERREEVLQYLYEKYGRDRAGMTAEVITYQVRSAVRDVGKALGLSPDRVDALAKALDHRHDADLLRQRFQEVGFSPDSPIARRLIEVVETIVHFPRHLSQHVGGMVITQGPLCELVPIENAAMEGRTVVQWDKNDLDALGILKVDCLALGMLTAIRKAFDLIARHYDRPLSLATVPTEDPAVYEMIQKADTVGVFQIESRAQMSMLPRLKPERFYDLVIEVAIVRPGPIQGDMVHPYLRRRRGEEPEEYPNDAIKAVLKKTLGVPLFQEQAMRLVVVAAGFTPGEADQLRRAMGAWRKRGVMDKFRDKLVQGMEANGYTAEFAERLFHQIQGFGEYGFPESHAASFALLVYVSAWIKRHYPDVFAAAIINSQPMGFYAPAQLVADARAHHVEVRPVDINESEWDCTLEEKDEGGRMKDEKEAGEQTTVSDSSFILHPSSFSLRLGFRLIRGLAQRHIEQMLRARADGPFTSMGDVRRRAGLRAPTLQKLALADAFRSIGLTRRAALWQALPRESSLPLFDLADDEAVPETLPAMTALGEVLADYGNAGLTLRRHPVSFLRESLSKRKIATSEGLAAFEHGDWVRVAGVVLLRQRPGTAKGITFVTLEDETGIVNLIIRRNVWEKYRRAARAAVVMAAHGRLQRDGDVTHVLVAKVEDISQELATVDVRSRDFR